MSDLERAYKRHAKALAAFRTASRALADDRNQRAGDVYEAQAALNATVRQRLDADYAASWVERWHR